MSLPSHGQFISYFDQFGNSYLDGLPAQPGDAHHGDQRRLLLLLVAEPDEAVALAEPRPVQHHCKAKVEPQSNLNLSCLKICLSTANKPAALIMIMR